MTINREKLIKDIIEKLGTTSIEIKSQFDLVLENIENSPKTSDDISLDDEYFDIESISIDFEDKIDLYIEELKSLIIE